MFFPRPDRNSLHATNSCVLRSSIPCASTMKRDPVTSRVRRCRNIWNYPPVCKVGVTRARTSIYTGCSITLAANGPRNEWGMTSSGAGYSPRLSTAHRGPARRPSCDDTAPAGSPSLAPTVWIWCWLSSVARLPWGSSWCARTWCTSPSSSCRCRRSYGRPTPGRRRTSSVARSPCRPPCRPSCRPPCRPPAGTCRVWWRDGGSS